MSSNVITIEMNITEANSEDKARFTFVFEKGRITEGHNLEVVGEAIFDGKPVSVRNFLQDITREELKEYISEAISAGLLGDENGE